MPPDRDHCRWHVLGAGAIGSLFAHRLASIGCDVTLLSRDAKDAQRTLTLESGMTVSPRDFPVSPCAAPAPVDHLLVTTKAADVDPAIASVSQRLHGATTVLVLANGMGFGRDLPHGLTAFRGTTTDGAFRRPASAGHAPGKHRTTVHAGGGDTRIGLPGSKLPGPEWFRRSWGLLQDCRWDGAIETTLWRKLAINCVINPLTAVYRCHNGELAAARYRPLLVALCDEITMACRATGRGTAVESLLQDTLEVIALTAANRSSMLQDVINARDTEIDHINGFLLGEPAVSMLDLPLNRQLITAVRQGRQLYSMLV